MVLSRISSLQNHTATELSRWSCSFECFMFAGHEAVIEIEMCTALGRVNQINLPFIHSFMVMPECGPNCIVVLYPRKEG